MNKKSREILLASERIELLQEARGTLGEQLRGAISSNKEESTVESYQALDKAFERCVLSEATFLSELRKDMGAMKSVEPVSHKDMKPKKLPFPNLRSDCYASATYLYWTEKNLTTLKN